VYCAASVVRAEDEYSVVQPAVGLYALIDTTMPMPRGLPSSNKLTNTGCSIATSMNSVYLGTDVVYPMAWLWSKMYCAPNSPPPDMLVSPT